MYVHIFCIISIHLLPENRFNVPFFLKEKKYVLQKLESLLKDNSQVINLKKAHTVEIPV